MDSKKPKRRRSADEIIKPKHGRTPGKRGVEKRIEEALTTRGGAREGAGRKRMTYDNRPEHIKYILDSCAMGFSTHRIRCLLQERYGEFGDEVVSLATITSYRKRYAGEIKEREIALRAEIPGMLPSNRMRVLQRIIDEAMEGEVIGLDREGNVVKKKNFQAANNAIKEMNAMQRDIAAEKPPETLEDRVAMELSEQKEIIREYIKQQLTEGKTELDVLKEIEKDFKEYEDAIGELTTEYTM